MKKIRLPRTDEIANSLIQDSVILTSAVCEIVGWRSECDESGTLTYDNVLVRSDKDARRMTSTLKNAIRQSKRIELWWKDETNNNENRAETSCRRTMLDVHVRSPWEALLRKHILLGDHQVISNMWLFWYKKAFIQFQTAIIYYITRSLKSLCILLEFWIISLACFAACFQIERMYLIREPCRLLLFRHLSIVLASMIDYFSLGACHGRFV